MDLLGLSTLFFKLTEHYFSGDKDWTTWTTWTEWTEWTEVDEVDPIGWTEIGVRFVLFSINLTSVHVVHSVHSTIQSLHFVIEMQTAYYVQYNYKVMISTPYKIKGLYAKRALIRI